MGDFHNVIDGASATLILHFIIKIFFASVDVVVISYINALRLSCIVALVSFLVIPIALSVRDTVKTTALFALITAATLALFRDGCQCCHDALNTIVAVFIFFIL